MTSNMSRDNSRLLNDYTDLTDKLYAETEWRNLTQPGSSTTDIAISRWESSDNVPSQGHATTPDDRFFIAIALKPTRLKLARGTQLVFEGSMPAGTLYVSGPSQELSAAFHAPFDFVHFHISNDYFSRPMSESTPDRPQRLNDLVLLRNPLAEQLARTLAEQGNRNEGNFARCVAQTLAMYLHQMEFPKARSNALPKWRLKRVEEYVKLHFDEHICLADLAKVAGLSRMHFAAQFRSATGYRPREYLLQQRIEQAKFLLTETETPLAEVALAVGFCTQAHFSTVFKRITHATPARWRYSDRETIGANRAIAIKGSNRSDRSLHPVRPMATPAPLTAYAR